MIRQAALPRRPLTVGELLDAAVQLLRGRPRGLLAIAVVLAVCEQALLFPLRRALGVDLIGGFEDGFWEAFAGLWVAMAVGCGLEAMIIVALGPWAGRMAAAEMTGVWRRPGAREAARVAPAAPAAGLATAIGAFFGPLWILGYALFGVSGAVIGLDRKGGLGRAAGLAFRGGRVTLVRVLGYLAWLLLRLGFGIGLLSVFEYLPVGEVGAFWVLTAGFVLANTAAYAFLSTLDAAAVVETRFRTEGLDIWLSRAERHAPLTPEALGSR